MTAEQLMVTSWWDGTDGWFPNGGTFDNMRDLLDEVRWALRFTDEVKVAMPARTPGRTFSVVRYYRMRAGKLTSSDHPKRRPTRQP